MAVDGVASSDRRGDARPIGLPQERGCHDQTCTPMDTNNAPTDNTTDESTEERTTGSDATATAERDDDAETVPPGSEADAAATPPEPPAIADRYAMLELGAESVVIYDRENADAWIQTDAPVGMPESAGGVLDG